MANKQLPAIPAELRNQLPIFQVLGDRVMQPLEKPAVRKTGSAALFWIIVLGGAAAFALYLPQILSFVQTLVATVTQMILLVAASVVLLVLILLAPKIISLLHRIGSTLLFKSEQSIIRNNPVASLQLILKDAKDTLKRVKEKITQVDGVRIDMIQSGQAAKSEAEEKYNLARRLIADSEQQEQTAIQAEQAQDVEQSGNLRRQLKETRNRAFLVGKEGEAEEQNARSYAQYANQFAKVMEVLKDNESAARIYVSTLDSSISIINKKLEATSKMKNATEGLAEVFNIKEGWVFNEAMGAATEAISNNIAHIRSNLEFLDENNSVTVGGTPSQEELNEFIRKVDERHLTTLNVAATASPAYDLKPEEKVDKGFSLLD